MASKRSCYKCGDKLQVNEELGYMECVSGRHIEPINTIRPQWWNECPKSEGGCGNKGLNGARQEPRVQDRKTLVLVEKVAEPIICKACGYTFTKR